MEIEYGVTPAETVVFSDYHDTYKKETELIKKAKEEIQILCSTANAFHIQKKGGLLRLLREMAEQNENLRISILSPIDTSTKESADDLGKKTFSPLNCLYAHGVSRNR